MKRTLLLLIAGLAAGGSALAIDLKYGGSQTVEPIVVAAVDAFKRANSQFNMPINARGTAFGLRDLCLGKITIAGASRPIKPQEMKDCAAKSIQPVELPIAMGAVTVIVSAANTGTKALTLEELRRIYEPSAAGKLTTWKDVRPGFAGQPLTAYGVGAHNASFEFFHAGIGNSGFVRMDMKDTPDHKATALAVAADPGGIGYVPLGVARDFESQVRIVAIDFGRGPVTPSPETVLNGSYPPLSRQLYLYLNPAHLEKLSDLDRQFIKNLVSGPERYVSFVNLIPLRDLQYQENFRKASFSR